MRLKTFLWLFLISLFGSVLYGNESSLVFAFFHHPENTIIPAKINFDEFEVVCQIEYSYRGDWIGGCSRKKYCYITRDYTTYAQLVCLDQNDKGLFTINLPESLYELKMVEGHCYWDGAENFVFREDLYYENEITILSPILFQFKELKELINQKKIHKIEITLYKFSVDWTYSCAPILKTSQESEEAIKGTYECNIDKKHVIRVSYE